LSTDARQRLATLSAEERNQLARRLAGRRPAAGGVRAIARRSADGDTFPLSFAQQRFWFLTQIAAINTAYNVGTLNRLEGPLDIRALKQALDEVARRHEVLRTTFSTIDGQPVQRVLPMLSVPLEFEDISGADDVAAELQQQIWRQAQQPWDLETGPLVRARVWRLAEGDHVYLALVHHIVSDGWSNAVFVREVSELYRAFANGQQPALAEPPVQYADFALWQHEWLKSADAERQLAYWKRHMADPPVLQLPTDSVTRRSSTGTHHWVVIPTELARGLRALSQREGVTLFMALLAAMASLLSRYSGQRDVVIGTPMLNRARPELENLIGCFMNPLPLRVEASGDPSFRTLLGRVRDVCLGAFANQEVPFDVVVRAVQPRRDPNNAPLFQAMLLLHNFWKSMSLTASGLDAGGFSLDPALLREMDGKRVPGDLVYPVALEVIEVGPTLLACFECAQEYRSVLDGMAGHFLQLLEAVIANPDADVRRVPLLTPSERAAQLSDWNHARREYPRVCPHRLIEAEAARAPSATAVVMGDDRLTYRELNEGANRIARRLRALGVGPEMRVGVLFTRSVRMVQAVLAVMKSGGAYVPLDPAYPSQRLSYILENAGVRVLLTEQSVLAAAGEVEIAPPDAGGPAILRLDADADEIARESGDDVADGADPDNAVYVIYTSGSTGKPKGTTITHASLANAYHAWEEMYELRTAARTHLQMASLSFDVFSGDFVRALCSGGTLVIAPQELLFTPERLLDVMKREKVDAAEFVPVVLRDLVAHLERTGEDLGFLNLLVAGSDTWYANEYRHVRSFGAKRVINSYGLTEATIDSTWFESENAEGDRPVPLGRAFPNTDLYVLDEFGQPSPVGVPGELHVGGAGLARGYFNAPDLTAERFVPHHFSDTPGARLYRTGDLARYLPDGTLEFLGRADHQVKLRGFRIELGEVESALADQPGVSKASAIIREDRPGDKRLVAYVVGGEGEQPSAASLRRVLKERLPEYMVPSSIVFLDAMPLTPNGKIDRRALPAPDGSRQSDQAFVAPQTDAERRIAAVWCEVLGLEKVGVEDNFFDLGGHSLLVVRLHARLQGLFERELAVLDIFRYPTIAALARQLTQAAPEDAFADAVRDRTRKQREAMARRRGGPKVAAS
jgi:amino acid adenylation domain-containing protein